MLDLIIRAARLGLVIDRIDDEDDWTTDTVFGAGPYVLRCAETGYHAHGCGMDTDLLATALRQIEDEPKRIQRANEGLATAS